MPPDLPRKLVAFGHSGLLPQTINLRQNPAAAIHQDWLYQSLIQPDLVRRLTGLFQSQEYPSHFNYWMSCLSYVPPPSLETVAAKGVPTFSTYPFALRIVQVLKVFGLIVPHL